MGVLTTPMDELEAATSLVGQDKKMELLPQLSPNLQESFERAEQKDARPYFGKLEQGESFVCPQALQEPGEQVEGLILYQTAEDETQMEKTRGGASGSPGTPMETAPACLSEGVEEITERQMEQEPFMDVSLVPSCDEIAAKTVPHSDATATAMELDSIYCGYTHHPSPAAPTTSPPIASLSDEGAAGSDQGVQTGVCVGQETYGGLAEDQNALPGILKCKSRASSRDRSSHGDAPRRGETDAAPASPPDAKSSIIPHVLLSSDGDCGSKPQEQQLPVKTEETEREPAEDMYPDSSDVKQGHFLSAVKAENAVAKDEQLDYPIKAETPEAKSELLAISLKPEVYSAFSDGAELKAETKPEDLELAAYPDSSEEKCKAKAEPLGFTLPDDKGKVKQELLEADSTVLTPKLEQMDGLVDAAAGLVAKGQAKKLCSPGNAVVLTSFLPT